MGYYSSVALVISSDAYDKLIDMCKRDREAMKFLFQMQAYPKFDIKDGSVLFYWQDVKWYDDNKAVAAIESLIKELPENQFQYVNVGEDINDITENGYSNFNLTCQLNKEIILGRVIERDGEKYWNKIED